MSWLSNFLMVLMYFGIMAGFAAAFVGAIVGPAWLTRYHQQWTVLAYLVEVVLIAAVLAFFITPMQGA